MKLRIVSITGDRVCVIRPLWRRTQERASRCNINHAFDDVTLTTAANHVTSSFSDNSVIQTRGKRSTAEAKADSDAVYSLSALIMRIEA